MFFVDQIGLPQLGLRGLEADMSEEERAIQESAHRFAEEVMRPIAEKLDKMSPEEVVAEGSPLWDYLRQIRESGLLDLEMIAGMSNEEKSRFIPIIFEESAWVPAGPVAECTLAYFGCDYGDGLFKEDGSQNLIAMLIPFDLDGISKGKPLDKLGQRSLPQGVYDGSFELNDIELIQ